MRCSLHSSLAQLPPSPSGTLAFPQPPQCDGTFRAEGTSTDDASARTGEREDARRRSAKRVRSNGSHGI